MTEDTSPENLRKFLESDDPGMVRMGLSMAKGIKIPAKIMPTLLKLYMWNNNSIVRREAGKLYFTKAPPEIKEIFKENWKSSYHKIKTVDLTPLLEALSVKKSYHKMIERQLIDHYTKVIKETQKPTVSGKVIKILGKMKEPGKKMLLKLLKLGTDNNYGRPNYHLSNGAAAARALSNFNDKIVEEKLINALPYPGKISLESSRSLCKLRKISAINKIEILSHYPQTIKDMHSRVSYTEHFFSLLFEKKRRKDMEKIILYYLIRIKEEKTNEGKKLMLRDLFFKSMIEGYPEGFAKEHFYNVLKETPKIVCWNKNKTRYKIQSHLILDLNEDIWLELIQNSIENKIQQSKEACIRALSTFENERTKRKACFVLESLLEDSGAKTQMNIAFELGKLGSHDKAIQILKKLKENPELDPHKDELGRKVNYKLNIEYILEDLYEKSKKYSELDIKQLRKICKKRKIDYVSKTKTRTKEEIIAMLENEE